MPLTLTTEATPLPLEWWAETTNGPAPVHQSTANVAPVALGGLWRGHTIGATDIQQARKEMWSKLEAGE